MDSTADRLGFTLFVAAVLHAALILGISFIPDVPGPRALSLEITLARYQQDKPVDHADYLAQFDQQGSGREEQVDELLSPVSSELNEVPDHPPDPMQGNPAAHRPDEQLRLISTQAESSSLDFDSVVAPSADATVVNSVADTRPAEPERASLIAKLDAQQRAYANRPLVNHLTSVATRRSIDAEYLLKWKRRIESIGNQNYPLEARRRRLYGDLRLLVVVRSDGSVADNTCPSVLGRTDS